MTTYDAHVGDSGTTISSTLTVAGEDLGDLTGATVSVRVTNPSGVVETWNAGFTPGAAGRLDFVTPNSAYWDEVGTWQWDVQYTLGGVTQTCDPILFSVGPSGTAPGSKTLAAAGTVSLYINANTGDDTNDGSDSSNAVQTWARIEALLPFYYTVSCTVTIVGTTAVVLADGQHRFPTPLGTALPVQIVGSYAQFGSGVVAAATADGIDDTVGGWSAGQWQGTNLFRVRFTSGPASGTIYTIVENDANTLTLAHAFQNGDTPTPGDTYVIEYPAGVLQFNDVQLIAPGPVIVSGIYFQGTGAGATPPRIPTGTTVSILQFTGGPWYIPNCFIYTSSGRTWVESGSLRTYDLRESLAPDLTNHGQINPFPDLIDGYYAFGQTTGDIAINSGGDVKGALVARNIDVVVEKGGVMDLLDFSITAVNQWQHTEGGIGKYAASPGHTSYARSVGTGSPLLFFDGAIGRIADVSLEGSQRGGAVDRSSRVACARLTGTVNIGPAMKVLGGGELVSEGGNTATGPGGAGAGEILVDSVTDLVWTTVDASPYYGVVRGGERT